MTSRRLSDRDVRWSPSYDELFGRLCRTGQLEYCGVTTEMATMALGDPDRVERGLGDGWLQVIGRAGGQLVTVTVQQGPTGDWVGGDAYRSKQDEEAAYRSTP